MSHTTRASGGTVFIHDGGYDGDVRVVTRTPATALTDPESGAHWETVVPFADLRELVFAYLRLRMAERIESMSESIENMSDDALEQALANGITDYA